MIRIQECLFSNIERTIINLSCQFDFYTFCTGRDNLTDKAR